MNVISTISQATTLPVWSLWLIAAALSVLSAGRMTRLVYYDAFPPAVWFRIQWDKLTEDNSWNLLMHCPWCLGFWMTVGSVGLFGIGLAVDWIMWAWWIGSAIFALGYLVPMVVARDEPDDD